MPVDAAEAKRLSTLLSDRELQIALELTAELVRLVGCHDNADATALLHSEVVSTLRRLHVRLHAASACDCTMGRHHAEWCASRPKPLPRTLAADEKFKAIGAGRERVVDQCRALYPAETGA